MRQIIVVFVFFVSTLWAVPLNDKPSARIIGGTDARAVQFPFSAAIFTTTPRGQHFCSGALIDQQWIVTAANCVQDATLFRIQLGSNLLNGTDHNRITLSTDTWYTHTQYNPAIHDYDIGLIKLRMPISFNDYIRPVNLPTRGLRDGQTVLAVGWGLTSDESPENSNHLKNVPLTIISNSECMLTYGNQIQQSMVCASGNYNEGLCTGDMGGPLLEQAGGLYLSGLGSFLSGNGCEAIDPSGFTRVYNFVPWIQLVMRNN